MQAVNIKCGGNILTGYPKHCGDGTEWARDYVKDNEPRTYLWNEHAASHCHAVN